MENKELLQKVSKLGFPLLEVEEKDDVNRTLAEVVKSRDARLFEGFSVLLANAVRDESFGYEKVESYLTRDDDKNLLKGLLLLSLSLYKSLDFYFGKNLYSKLSEENLNKLKELRNSFAHNANFNLMGYAFSTEKLKDVFTAYLRNEVEEVKKQTEKQEDFSVEYALSQVFSPKQKELFLKRVKGENLNKTEREYFSRTVKKKLLALANPEVHRFAKLLLEST
ncbi:MAG: hypothetical protein Q8Q08_04290 [Candidatus Omnitrophota bacterium]|nr:hypothetical protein [Candidatus Omnitrophota bacterium]